MAQAAVFPGQGAQRAGMAADFVEQYEEARRAFERAQDTLPFDVYALCHGGDERLDLTEFTQPCILAAEIAMLEALRAHFGFQPEYFGGHSLGEYAALVAAGALPLEAALELVHLRGRLMQRAVPPGAGAMAAVIMAELPLDEVRQLAAEHEVDVANDNSPAQVVLSGKAEPVARAAEALSARFQEGVRVVPLTVSAPFHSRWMGEIEAEFRQALEASSDAWAPERARAVTANVTGGFHSGARADLIDALARQLSGAVRWRDNVCALAQRADQIVEVGPNRPLRGFFKAMGVTVQSVTDVRTAERALGPNEEGD